MIYIKNVFKICFVLIGTIIGAGFASGKEIFSFFCIYGINGVYGIFISNFIIGVVIYVTFSKALNSNINTYSDYINTLLKGKNKIINYSLNNIMNIFLLISFVVMVSGFGAYFRQEFKVPAILGAIIISILAFITFFKNLDGIIKINTFLIPFLIIFIVILGFNNRIFLCNIKIQSFSKNLSCLIKAILYGSYNSITLVPVIISLKNNIKNKCEIKLITIFTCIFLLGMSLIIYIVLSSHFIEIKNIDIPLVYIASKFGIIYKYIYGLVILMAIFTTAISQGYSFLNNMAQTKKQYIIYSIIICLVAVIFSNIGFGNLLEILYPILGFLGLFQIIIL